jgi:hypothetical protein
LQGYEADPSEANFELINSLYGMTSKVLSFESRAEASLDYSSITYSPALYFKGTADASLNDN